MQRYSDPYRESKDSDLVTADEILEKATKVQHESLSSLDRIFATIEMTKSIGAETAAKLSQQVETLKKLYESSEVTWVPDGASNGRSLTRLRKSLRSESSGESTFLFNLSLIGRRSFCESSSYWRCIR